MDRMDTRLSTGLERLDEALGGGLLPGTLTMVVGATGVGKTQLAMHFLEAGIKQEGVTGAIIDLSSRGDSQNHAGYRQRMFGKPMSVVELSAGEAYQPFEHGRPAEVFPFLGYTGRRVLRSQLDADEWHAWQSEMNRRTPTLTRFLYGHLVHGTRRFIVDGIEPQHENSDSLQLDLVELIYHRMLRTEHDWLAREVFREKYLQNESLVAQHRYSQHEAAAAALLTTKQSMLDQLIAEPLSDGDLAAGANTVILLGRTFKDAQLHRGLYIAKHRGSYAEPKILSFDINDKGIQFLV